MQYYTQNNIPIKHISNKQLRVKIPRYGNPSRQGIQFLHLSFIFALDNNHDNLKNTADCK